MPSFSTLWLLKPDAAVGAAVVVEVRTELADDVPQAPRDRVLDADHLGAERGEHAGRAAPASWPDRSQMRMCASGPVPADAFPMPGLTSITCRSFRLRPAPILHDGAWRDEPGPAAIPIGRSYVPLTPPAGVVSAVVDRARGAREGRDGEATCAAGRCGGGAERDGDRRRGRRQREQGPAAGRARGHQREPGCRPRRQGAGERGAQDRGRPGVLLGALRRHRHAQPRAHPHRRRDAERWHRRAPVRARRAAGHPGRHSVRSAPRRPREGPVGGLRRRRSGGPAPDRRQSRRLLREPPQRPLPGRRGPAASWSDDRTVLSVWISGRSGRIARTGRGRARRSAHRV